MHLDHQRAPYYVSLERRTSEKRICGRSNNGSIERFVSLKIIAVCTCNLGAVDFHIAAIGRCCLGYEKLVVVHEVYRGNVTRRRSTQCASSSTASFGRTSVSVCNTIEKGSPETPINHLGFLVFWRPPITVENQASGPHTHPVGSVDH